MDALWSDPKSSPGVDANALRGGGCLFGPNVTAKFLERNNLSLIIRSHECKEQGYDFTHNDRLLTIFSASNYYEYDSNKGAYIRITSAVQKPVITQFQVKKEGQENLKNASLKEREGGAEASAIKNLLQIFAANKIRLMQAYKAKDPPGNGVLSLNDWCVITTDILGLNLPWRTLRPRLVEVNKNGLVLYRSAFDGLMLTAGKLTVKVNLKF